MKKYIGRDCELSTSGVDADGRTIPSWDVTRAILEKVDAAFEEVDLKTWSSSSGRGGFYASPYSIDCLRHWAPTGQSFYSDMSHFEACTAASLSPRMYAAQSFALLRVAEAARRRAEDAGPDGTRYSLSTSNLDMLDPSISWGTHDSVTVTPELWHDLCGEMRHPAVLGFVASALAAAVPFFGSGCLIPLKDGTVLYSLSARAHHVSRIRCDSTTEAFRRGLINTRREPHGEGHQRLHLICFDYTLASAALKCSFLQCVLAAAENGFSGLNLHDPVRALRSWSWELDEATGDLPATAVLTDGRSMTLPAYIREVASQLLEMCEAKLINEEDVPEAFDLLPRIIELSHHLERGDIARCARHLDWAAKLLCLRDLAKGDGVQLGDAVTRLADHDFASSDPDEGLFWRIWDRGLVDPLIDKVAIDACLREGPPESRDWGRGQIIRKFFHSVTDVDWGTIELRRDETRFGRRLRIELPRMDTFTKAEFAPVLASVSSVSELDEALGRQSAAIAEDTDPLIDFESQLPASTVGNGRTDSGEA